MTAGTIGRSLILVLALVNQLLTYKGMSPLPIEDETVTECVTYLFTFGASVSAWWYNNSFTTAAQQADAYYEAIVSEEA